MAALSARVLVRLLPLLACCGDEPARLQLAPLSPCGQVLNETALRVVAYTAGGEQRRSVPPGAPTEIGDFPEDTVQLGVEVIGDGGRLVAVGKTAPLDLGAIPDGSALPIVMAPLAGFCAVGPMTEPRRAPVVARAGGGVLVVGGISTTGDPLGTAELYDPATASFTPVDVPATLVDPLSGLAGAVLTELADGRVVLTGTAGHAISFFEPETRRFSTPSLFDRRAFHAATLVDADRLLVIGGCEDVVSGACSGSSVTRSYIYDLTDVTRRSDGPALESSASRLGARVLPLGVQLDGTTRFLLAGGLGDTGVTDRFALADPAAERISGVFAQVTPLDGGAVMTAFASDASAANGASNVLPPDGTMPVPISAAPAIVAARLASLEDGSVVAIGNTVARYNPTSDDWSSIDAPALLPSASITRLDDGTLLVLGSTTSTTSTTSTSDAWIFRPSLVGPTSGSVIVVPGADGDAVLTPSDPSTVERTAGRFVLVSRSDTLHARALVGGPRMRDGSVSAIVRVTSGGVALLARQTAPGALLVGRLVPGERAQIVQLAAGTEVVLCSGSVVSESEIAQPVTLAISRGEATLSVGPSGASLAKVGCDVPDGEAGAWGIAALGAGARVEVGPVTVARSR